MIEAWIPLTVFAAFMQNLRSALQKHLKSRLSDAGATYVRFLYAWPFALMYCWGVVDIGGYQLPAVNSVFLIYSLLGAVAQIVFTFLLVYLFSFRNFAVGTTFSKTEIIQVALLGYLLLGDRLSLIAGLAIALSLVGVMVLSVARTRLTLASLHAGLTDKATLIGLASGLTVGASVIFYRGAALSLEADSAIMRAAFSLAVSVTMQTVIMGAYLLAREPGQFGAVVRHWRWALPGGVAAVLASIGWFTAFTLENAAYVRALGQIELVFTFIASVFFFREETTPTELAGIALIIVAILILVLAK
jgi:drug/metabolite transporter (DMT)-like permease